MLAQGSHHLHAGTKINEILFVIDIFLIYLLSAKFLSELKSSCACMECEPYASIQGCLKRHELLRDTFNTVMFLWTMYDKESYFCL